MLYAFAPRCFAITSTKCREHGADQAREQRDDQLGWSLLGLAQDGDCRPCENRLQSVPR
jgi:hypothetical protein